MVRSSYALSFSVILCGQIASFSQAAFSLAPQFSLTGYILGPALGIPKPFSLFHDGIGSRSRLDFYGGDKKHILRNKSYYTLFWSTRSATHIPVQTCRHLRHDGDPNPVTDLVLRNLDQVEFVRAEPCDAETTTVHASVAFGGMSCNRYEYRVEPFVYVLWAARDPGHEQNMRPVRVLSINGEKTETLFLTYTLGIQNDDVFNVEQLTAAIPSSTLQSPRAGFAREYTVTGYLMMPRSGIEEPFSAHCDGDRGKYRVDYYHGAMKTLRISSDIYKVHWSPNEETHIPEENCEIMPVGRNEYLEPGGVLPDLSDFKLVRTESCGTGVIRASTGLSESECHRFEKITQDRDRVSNHVFWASRTSDHALKPVRYRVLKYDNHLRSHFDEYEIIYEKYRAGVVNPDLFEVGSVTDKQCTKLPTASQSSARHLFDPIREFVSNNDSHVDEHFAEFKNTHGKAYESASEDRKRRHNFHHKMRFVNSMNRRNLSYALALNERSDQSRDEVSSQGGCLRIPKVPNAPSDLQTFSAETCDTAGIPDTVDWRLEGVVTPVKNQGTCGSCYSFASVAYLESQYIIRNGKGNTTRFSEQQIVDCSWDSLNIGCKGGFPHGAFEYVQKYGLFTEDQYGPYLDDEGKCRDAEMKGEPIIPTLKSFTMMEGAECLLRHVGLHGPIAVGIHGSSDSFRAYSRGIYNDPTCDHSLTHAVLVVGYGSLRGEPYWLVKNSWGPKWGAEGYILVSRKENYCGIENYLAFAEL
ncbi:counting factor associated protein D [Galendromus occidentalis]|uniref:Counting factor associated protein D n=1 Tax=Galendromus occidentalis TaxID=34638 RepID=A0AAJ6VZ37_9ACAR|nr:counting factor associated protein D [Galendromus occidentalis]